MAEIPSPKSHQIPLLSFLFLLQLLSFLLPSSSYTLPDKYFINCGSDTNVTVTRRTFIGDSSPGNSDSFRINGQSETVEDSNDSTISALYRAARIFRQKSSYEFVTSAKGTYLVRLHFFAFRSQQAMVNLSAGLFDVSASGFSLLRSFDKGNSTESPLIKEFFLPITVEKFAIDFLPQESSFAFVNAIEVFLVPDGFFPDGAPFISQIGQDGSYNGIPSDALQTVHRVNVGGSKLTPDNDTLFRYWVPDDTFLYNPATAKKILSSGPVHFVGAVTQYFAPNYVYQTAKEMNINSNVDSNNFNITWSFNVQKISSYFLRLHFCDIVSSSLNEIIFNLYIYSKFSKEISYNTSYSYATLGTPFYIDFVVHSDASGVLNISIGPREDSTVKNAFLNGLEIMEMVGVSGSLAGRNEHKKSNNVFVIVGLVVGGLALICASAFVLCFILRRRKGKTVESLDWSAAPVQRRGSSDTKMPVQTIIGPVVPVLNLGLRISFAEIQYATNYFDEKMIIGKGGFGNVYRGTLPNGTKVAVKRSKPGSGQGLPEFQTEIMVLSRIRHLHLVSLIGYCDERSEMILVYEYMEKGTLRDHLCNSAFPSLCWRERLEICIGAAKGLQYLHRGCSGGFIHRDVKSTNILLDENLVAKVADFGLSRLGASDQVHVSTGVKGTFGYLDPDYFRTQQLTEKSDVYSFGVVLLEVLCARPALDGSLPPEQVNLAEWGMFCKRKGTLDEIVDPSIKNQINPNSLRKFVETAEKCLQEYGSDRPNMADVQWDLEYAMQLQQTPAPRELHDYSVSDPSALLQVPNFQSLPSISMSMGDKDDFPILGEHLVDESQVFSQLNMKIAR